MNNIDLSGAKVLMVDDTPANIDVLRKVLSIEGYRLSFANSGEKALKILERAIPDLILLDVMMPGMDGFETCRHLKADEKTRDIPIIFITAKTDMEDLVEGFKAGAVDYIAKPFRQEEVCMRVRTHLQTRILMIQRESLLQNIRANEERFRLLSNWSPVGIFQVDNEGKLTYTNRKWHDILGVNDTEMLEGEWLNAAIHGEDRELVQQTWQNSLQSREGYALKFRLITASGNTRWVHVQTTPLFLGNQELNGFIGTIEDITEFKLNEQQMRNAKESAEAIARAKAEFLSGMTHELRTPLNAIIGYSEMLSEDVTGEGYGEDLEKITSASKYLLNLINNVLDLSKVEANRMTLYLEEFNIPLLIKEVVSTIQPLVKKNNNALDVSIDLTTQTMYADATKVRQILYNLLSNACKFTKEGTIILRVQAVQEEIEFVEFSVIDTGIGLTEEQLEKLFQKYAQADASIARDYGGTGLGLVLTQQFCNMMGGSVHVNSKHGAGSEFSIRLPRQVTKELHKD